MVLLTLTLFRSTFALFETNSGGKSEVDIGKWIIKINNEDITSGNAKTITVDNFVYTESSTVASGKIAPGGSAYFDLTIDATECDVAVKYDVNFDFTSNDYAENISFVMQDLSGNTIRTGESMYSSIVSLASIRNNETTTLRVTITWEDMEDYNDSDYALGSTLNSKLTIPITVTAIQYLGEPLVPYVEPTEPIEEDPSV